MIDRKAFRALSSGLCLITAREGGRDCGCVVNTLVQVASAPPTLAVSLNKDNATTAAVRESGRFAATVLAQDAPMELIGTFGFHSSADTDKFAACSRAIDGAEVPYVADHALARFSVTVTETIDVGSHYLFVGTVEEAEMLAEGDALTYAYYHAVKGGKTPPKAATYNGGDEAPLAGVTETAASAPDAGKRIAWRCTICGYIEEGYPDGLPADYMCPICGAGRDFFERVEL
ncbi:flavin reductase [Adlercreutzia muris]|uniref:flavin reductase n=1 Tax=Adlercreutzia muris TaxID=1796610 RepID=UPI001F592AA1|nr:flavin reductase [Adlercreutzia muris]